MITNEDNNNNYAYYFFVYLIEGDNHNDYNYYTASCFFSISSVKLLTIHKINVAYYIIFIIIISSLDTHSTNASHHSLQNDRIICTL